MNLVENFSPLNPLETCFLPHDPKGLTFSQPSSLLTHQPQQRTHIEFLSEELIVISHSPVNLLFQLVHRQGWILPVGAWGPGQEWHALGFCSMQAGRLVRCSGDQIGDLPHAPRLQELGLLSSSLPPTPYKMGKSLLSWFSSPGRFPMSSRGALPTSSVRPLDKRKELEWLPACLYFLNLMRKCSQWKSKHRVKRDQSLALYLHISIQLPKSPLPNKQVLLETGPAPAEAAPFHGDPVPLDGPAHRQHARIQPRGHNSIFWLVWLLCVAPSPGLTGDDHHTRWRRDKWVEHSGGEIRISLSNKILVFPQCNQGEAQSFRMGGHWSGYKSPTERQRHMTNYRGV